MMYFVATRLSAPSTDPKYADLVNAITALGPWSDRLEGTWLLESKLPASRIRTLLKPHLLEGDRVFVGQFSQNWSGFNMGKNFPEWIKRRDFDVPKAG